MTATPNQARQGGAPSCRLQGPAGRREGFSVPLQRRILEIHGWAGDVHDRKGGMQGWKGGMHGR